MPYDSILLAFTALAVGVLILIAAMPKGRGFSWEMDLSRLRLIVRSR